MLGMMGRLVRQLLKLVNVMAVNSSSLFVFLILLMVCIELSKKTERPIKNSKVSFCFSSSDSLMILLSLDIRGTSSKLS